MSNHPDCLHSSHISLAGCTACDSVCDSGALVWWSAEMVLGSLESECCSGSLISCDHPWECCLLELGAFLWYSFLWHWFISCFKVTSRGWACSSVGQHCRSPGFKSSTGRWEVTSTSYQQSNHGLTISHVRYLIALKPSLDFHTYCAICLNLFVVFYS